MLNYFRDSNLCFSFVTNYLDVIYSFLFLDTTESLRFCGVFNRRFKQTDLPKVNRCLYIFSAYVIRVIRIRCDEKFHARSKRCRDYQRERSKNYLVKLALPGTKIPRNGSAARPIPLFIVNFLDTRLNEEVELQEVAGTAVRRSF